MIEDEEYDHQPVNYPTIKQAIGLALYFLLFSAIADIPVEVVKSAMHVHDKTVLSVLSLMAYILGAVATIWFGFKRYRNVDGLVYKFRFNKAPVIPVIVSALIILTMPVLTDPLSVLIPMPDSVKKMFDDLFDPNVATFFSVIIAAPILEEAIFRGIILNGLLKNYPPQTAIIASAAIFAAVHLNPWQAIPAFLGGLLMSWMYWKTNSIIPGIILHFCNNLFATILGLVYKNADSLKQLMSNQAYIGLYVFCSIIMIGGWLFLEKYFNDNPTPEDVEEPELEYLGEKSDDL